MPDLRDVAGRRVVYALPGMDRVVVRKDLVYRETNEGPLKLDVYRPSDAVSRAPGRPAAGEPLPAVIFVHGDGPPDLLRHAKDWGQYVSWGELAAVSGLAAVTFNHRSTERLTRITEVATDVDACLEYVREHAADLGIDPERLALWVCSAGGPLGMRAALTGAVRFRCAVAYYAVLDLTGARGSISTDVADAVLEEFSPLVHLRREGLSVPPLLIARAGQDREPLNATIDAFVAQALARNLPIEVWNHPDGRHGFDILDDLPRSRQIIRRTLDFLREHLLDVGGEAGFP